jgi:hypothetical protein
MVWPALEISEAFIARTRPAANFQSLLGFSALLVILGGWSRSVPAPDVECHVADLWWIWGQGAEGICLRIRCE